MVKEIDQMSKNYLMVKKPIQCQKNHFMFNYLLEKKKKKKPKNNYQ